jgi:hypothetical protein
VQERLAQVLLALKVVRFLLQVLFLLLGQTQELLLALPPL